MTSTKDAVRVLALCAVIASALPLVYRFFSSPVAGIPLAAALLGLVYFVLMDARTSLTGELYARRLGTVNAALLIFTLAFPFLLFALYKFVRPARDIPFGLITTIFVKPTVYVAYVLAVLAITRQRFGSLNLDRVWLTALAVALYSSTVFWLAASAPWSVGFSLGASGGVPIVALAVYAALLPLCFVMPSGSAVAIRQSKVLNSGLRAWCSLMLAAIVIWGVASELLKFTSNYELMRKFSTLGFWLAPIASVFPLILLTLCYRLWVAAGHPGDRGTAKITGTILVVVIAACAGISTLVSIGNLLIWFPLSSWQTLNKVASILRGFELWALMLLPLVIARLLASPAGSMGNAASGPDPKPQTPRAFGTRRPAQILAPSSVTRPG